MSPFASVTPRRLGRRRCFERWAQLRKKERTTQQPKASEMHSIHQLTQQGAYTERRRHEALRAPICLSSTSSADRSIFGLFLCARPRQRRPAPCPRPLGRDSRPDVCGVQASARFVTRLRGPYPLLPRTNKGTATAHSTAIWRCEEPTAHTRSRLRDEAGTTAAGRGCGCPRLERSS